MKTQQAVKTKLSKYFLRALLGLFVSIVVSCTANKKVVDDELDEGVATEESVSDTEAVSEDDLFAENTMEDAGTETQSQEAAPSEAPAEAQASETTPQEAPAEPAPEDEFAEFADENAGGQQPADQNQVAQSTEPQAEPSLDELNLEDDSANQAQQNADLQASPESLAQENTAPSVEGIPAPEIAEEVPAPVVEEPVITTPEPTPESSVAETGIEPIVPSTDVNMDPSQMARIQDVQFRGNQNGGALVIKADRELQFSTRLNSTTNQVVVEVQNAIVPRKLRRPLITKDMSSSIGTIDIYQRANSSVARFVIQLRADSPEPLIQPEGDSLIVIGAPMGAGSSMAAASTLQQQSPGNDIVNSVVPNVADGSQSTNPGQTMSPIASGPRPINIEQQQLPSSVIPLQSNGVTVDPSVATGYDGTRLTPANQDVYTKGLLSSKDLQDFLANNNKYYGKKISIVTQDLEVKDVLNFLSEEASVNLIYDDDVAGRVNIKLRRVPWDQALVTLLKSKKLGYQRQGSILRIAKIETLLKEEDDAVKIRDARLDQETLIVRNFRINYAEIASLEAKIKEFIADTKKDAVNRGRVSSDARTNTIIVTETPTKLKQVEELIAALDTQPQQVQIEARIIEAQESFSKSVGVKWGLNQGTPGSSTVTTPFNRGQVATGLSGTDLSVMPSIGTSPGIGTTGGALTSQLWFGRIGALGDLELNLSLGQIENKLKVLSSPRIVVLSGTSASVNQRVRINVPDESTTVSTGTSTTAQQKFKSVEAGVRLSVTPQISNIDTVRLKLDLAKSVITDPLKGDTSERTAQSEIILKSMQTAVIGGVFESQQNFQQAGVPGLQDIPVLGALFRGKNDTSSKSELMIFVTPKILPPLTIPVDAKSMMPANQPPQNSNGATQQLMDNSMATQDPAAGGAIPPPETSEDDLELELE